ncbi:MAG: stage II sporulation protein P [Limnochordia bacterium]
MRRTERNGPGLLFILVTLVVVAVVGARFLGFYPQSGEDDLGPPQQDAAHEEAPPEGPVVDPTPKVLVFHSHASENYHPNESHTTGQIPGDVVAVGKALVDKLSALGITALHDTTIHDKPRYSEAFINSDRMVEAVLKEHPEIQIVLDIHRDGLQDKPENYTRAEVQGMPVAKILFVVGDKDNTKVEENLQFAQSMSDALEAKYPGVSRGVRVFKSDYSGELHPNSVMVLVGDWRGNTLEEAIRSAELLAEVIVSLIK